LSKRKIKNGWLEEPRSSFSPLPGEEPSEPGPSHRNAGKTNGVESDGPAASPAGPEPPPAGTPESTGHEPDLSPSIPAGVSHPEAPSATTPAPPSADEIPIAKITPIADLSPLEQRVRRLEEALAQLQASRSSVPPPRERFTEHRPPILLPAPVPATEGKGLVDAVRRSIAPAEPPVAPSAAALVPAGVRRHWFLMDVVADLRAMARMCVDPRYRMSKAGWAVSLGLLVAFFLSYWWVPGTIIPLFGYWINKAVDLALAYALFRVLTREARRYRETAPDLPPSLRL
jgi:hypothetical protein